MRPVTTNITTINVRYEISSETPLEQTWKAMAYVAEYLSSVPEISRLTVLIQPNTLFIRDDDFNATEHFTFEGGRFVPYEGSLREAEKTLQTATEEVQNAVLTMIESGVDAETIQRVCSDAIADGAK